MVNFKVQNILIRSRCARIILNIILNLWKESFAHPSEFLSEAELLLIFGQVDFQEEEDNHGHHEKTNLKAQYKTVIKKTTNLVSFLSALMTLFIKCLTFVIPKGSLKSFGVISFPVKQSRKVGKKFTLFTTFKTRKYRKYKSIQSLNSNYE